MKTDVLNATYISRVMFDCQFKIINNESYEI